MTDERLAEIRHCIIEGHSYIVEAERDIEDLLFEMARMRAELALATELCETVDDQQRTFGGLWMSVLSALDAWRAGRTKETP